MTANQTVHANLFCGKKMTRTILTLSLSFAFLARTPPPDYAAGGGGVGGEGVPTSQYDPGTLIFTTNLGWFAVQLYSDLAPITTDNFMRKVKLDSKWWQRR